MMRMLLQEQHSCTYVGLHVQAWIGTHSYLLHKIKCTEHNQRYTSPEFHNNSDVLVTVQSPFTDEGDCTVAETSESF